MNLTVPKLQLWVGLSNKNRNTCLVSISAVTVSPAFLHPFPFPLSSLCICACAGMRARLKGSCDCPLLLCCLTRSCNVQEVESWWRKCVTAGRCWLARAGPTSCLLCFRGAYAVWGASLTGHSRWPWLLSEGLCHVSLNKPSPLGCFCQYFNTVTGTKLTQSVCVNTELKHILISVFI